MLLTVDVGNTNTVLGLFDGEHLFESYRIKTDQRVTADELALMFRGLLSEHPAPDGVAVCSTVPSVLEELRRMFDRYFSDVPTVVVGPGVKTGVPLLKDIPILGQLFSSTRFQKNESELIVIVTPTMVDPLRPRPEDVMRLQPDTTKPALDAIQRRLPPNQRRRP